jgi:hypothetical protein
VAPILPGLPPEERTVRALVVVASIALALLLALAPAASADEKVPIGDRITLFGDEFQVFPAGEPFHIFHGWGLRHLPGPGAEADGRFGFDLAIDGVERREDYVNKFHEEHPTLGHIRHRNWVYNFPDGLTGTHTFTGHWFGACTVVVAAGLAPGPCEHPTEITTAIAPLTITVVFG